MIVQDLNAGEMLQWYARYREAYSKYCCRAIIKEPFSPNEMNLLIFLSNNPHMDTAKVLTVTLGVSKSLVCRSVDSLMQKGYLRGEVDPRDHRITHLILTEKAAPIIPPNMALPLKALAQMVAMAPGTAEALPTRVMIVSSR